MIQPTSEATEGGEDGMNEWKWVRGNSEVVEVLPAATYKQWTNPKSFLLFTDVKLPFVDKLLPLPPSEDFSWHQLQTGASVE